MARGQLGVDAHDAADLALGIDGHCAGQQAAGRLAQHDIAGVGVMLGLGAGIDGFAAEVVHRPLFIG